VLRKTRNAATSHYNMDDTEVTVLRYGHRPGRDDRMTTHVGLTARALGADRIIFPDNAGTAADTVEEVTGRFGGPFSAELCSNQRRVAENWDGVVVHLTMYGLGVEDVETEIRDRATAGESVLIIVGGEKVPFEIYEAADYNVGVTNQPHSEVAGLAVFLDHLFGGAELDQEWERADREVIPTATGKRVVDPAESPATTDPEHSGHPESGP
jgi:Uncharacterized protein conserved in archaea